MIIYCIENMINHKKYYGKSTDFYKRLYRHIHEVKNNINRYLYDAIRKYGIDMFTAYIVEYCNNINCNEREKYYINKYKTNDKNFGYNMTCGGDGGYTLKNWNEIEKLKLYKSQGNKRKGHIVTKEVREKISNSNKGKIISEKQKKQTSNTLKRKFQDGTWIPNTSKIIEMSKTKHPMKGRKHTIEAKKRMSIIKKDKKRELSHDVLQKMSDRLKGEKNPLYKNINIEDIIKYIKMKYTADKISKILDCSKITIYNKVKQNKNKTFGQLQKEILDEN